MTRSVVPAGVHRYVETGVLEPADVEGARILITLADSAGSRDRSDLLWVLVGLALRTVRDGHSCVDLGAVGAWGPESSSAVRWPAGADEWLAVVAANSDLIGSPAALSTRPRPPLVCDGGRVYLSRVFAEEEFVARRLVADSAQGVRIVLGGPGTGKTTWVARTLADWVGDDIPSIALCAPTGKASRHLKSVLERRLRDVGASAPVMEALSRAPSVTIHRLLGYSPGRSPRYAFNQGNPLPYGLVIVDEASMLSLNSMARLVSAISPDAQLWLVGDPHQLASVESGTVLADIAKGASNPASVLHHRRTILTEQHRFKKESPIARLADAVREGDVDGVMAVLRAGGDGFAWIDPVRDTDRFAALFEHVVDHANRVMQAATSGEVERALRAKSELQVLSATRSGPLGVWAWNQLVEKKLGPSTSSGVYAGKPVLVTRNDSATGLANGDVGVVCRVNGELRAYFGDADAPVEIPLVRLTDVDTVHALTIHKSQGSEYRHAVVVLPDAMSRIVSRELLYTGVSRPTTSLTVVATEEAIRRAVSMQVQRATGLADRL